MTTLTPFTPSPRQPFSFGATFDGDAYNVTLLWLLFGARWYVQVTAADGTLVVFEGRAGSPPAQELASLTWSGGKAIGTTSNPHGFQVGNTVTLTIDGVSPSAYNGTFPCLITGPTMFSYPLSSNPGQVTSIGTVAYNVNLVGGYFTSSSLVWRPSTNNFEVNP